MSRFKPSVVSRTARLIGGAILLALVALAPARLASAAEFRAASAKADITPSDMVNLWGYGARTGSTTGAHDPLYAKILLLDDGENRLALITLDLGRPFGQKSMDVVRDRVRKSANVTNVCFNASHTHSGPFLGESYPEGKIPAWESAALDRIAKEIEGAAARLEPALIGTGEGSVLIGHNRRLVSADGKVKMLWRNATKTPTHPLDPRVGIIRVDNKAGEALAVMVNYACHPVVYGPDNLQYSADFPSAMAEVVEGKLGKNVVCLYLQGAAGDINPYYDKMRIDEGAEALMKETGKNLGNEALRVAESIKTAAPKTPEIQVSLETRHFGQRFDAEKLLERRRATATPEQLERFRASMNAPFDCIVTTILINREIAIMGMPGEPFVEFGLNFRDRSPVANSYFAGYMNGYHGYFPTIVATVGGGYGADGTRIEVGAGEAMVNTAIIRLYTMLGKLKSVP